jgi:nucleoid-associated protein YgaU
MSRACLLCCVVMVGILSFSHLAYAGKFAITGRIPPKEEIVVEKPTPSTEHQKLGTVHVVVEGECLFYIAAYREYYGDPFKWPLIYAANKDKIANPHWIYPGQEFYIPPE